MLDAFNGIKLAQELDPSRIFQIISALASGLFFLAYQETRGSFGFLLLAGYLVMNGVVGAWTIPMAESLPCPVWRSPPCLPSRLQSIAWGFSWAGHGTLVGHADGVPGALGLVHGPVGVPQDLVELAGRAGAGDPDADGDVKADLSMCVFGGGDL